MARARSARVKPAAWRNQINSAIGCISPSMNTPVGSPLASFSIVSTSTGETVSRVMPARLRASVLVQDTSGKV